MIEYAQVTEDVTSGEAKLLHANENLIVAFQGYSIKKDGKGGQEKFSDE